MKTKPIDAGPDRGKSLSQLALGQLAKIANDAHHSAEATAVNAIDQAIQAGAALAEIKARLKHGEWIPWLEEHFEGSAKTAENYLRVFKRQDKLLSNPQRVADLGSLRSILKLLSGGEPHVSKNTGEVEWYTPPEYIEAARRIMGEIDLDPASCEAANEIVKAKNFYSEDDDGLSKPWFGRIWMNPPYSAGIVDAFSEKMVAENSAGRVKEACVLINNATETDWFRSLAGAASAICFPDKRIKFIDRDGSPSGAPLQGQAVIYIGKEPGAFVEEMSSFGVCWVKPR